MTAKKKKKKKRSKGDSKLVVKKRGQCGHSFPSPILLSPLVPKNVINYHNNNSDYFNRTREKSEEATTLHNCIRIILVN